MEKKCFALAKDTVCLETEVKIKPEVKIGRVFIKCKGDAFIGRCPGTPQESCTFFVSQRIEVKVPIDFDADVFAEAKGIVCGEPKIEEWKDAAADADAETECESCK